MIETGEAKSQSDLARQISVSRVRVNQIIRLLKLDEEIMKAIERLGDPMPKQLITERMLRPHVKNSKSKDVLLNELFMISSLVSRY